MAKSGIERVDKLFEGDATAEPIVEDDPDVVSVGLIQDLLVGHGERKLPNVRSLLYGKFTAGTKAAIKRFRKTCGLPKSNQAIVDHAMLVRLIEEPATNPTANICYLTLKLNFPRTDVLFVLTFVAAFEGRGQFAAINPNTDRQGLSFGLIQWAQSRKMLHEILVAFKTSRSDLFNKYFGGEPLATQLLAHTGLGAAGLCSKTDIQPPPSTCVKVGRSKNSALELTDKIWQERFTRAGRDTALQKTQVQEALRGFNQNVGRIRGYATAIRSVRGFAFMLDLSNQHGPFRGKHNTGARAIYEKAFSPGMTEAAVLAKMQEESVRLLKKQYGDNSKEARSTIDRRDFFRTSPVLPETDFVG